MNHRTHICGQTVIAVGSIYSFADLKQRGFLPSEMTYDKVTNDELAKAGHEATLFDNNLTKEEFRQSVHEQKEASDPGQF